MQRIKAISDVVPFPNGCETVRFTACLVSMLMRAKKMAPDTQKHQALYNLYTAVTGFGFMQLDLSNDAHMGSDWNQSSNVLLRELDWYIGFAFDYAGYETEELIFQQDDKATDFAKIKASIDRDAPVLALFGQLYQWVLITGYDDAGALYGYDGSQGYWGRPVAAPAGYTADGLFIMPDWYEKGGHAFILGNQKEPASSVQGVMLHGIKLMEQLQERHYLQRSEAFMRDDANFDSRTDEELLTLRNRIAGWIGLPIDQRSMLAAGMKSLLAGDLSERERAALVAVHRLGWTSHDVLWIAWRAIGEHMGGDKAEWARGLRSRTIRHVIADCVKFVREHDEYMLGELKLGFE